MSLDIKSRDSYNPFLPTAIYIYICQRNVLRIVLLSPWVTLFSLYNIYNINLRGADKIEFIA